MSFAVYCAVLPSGWFVDTGSWSAGGGGRLDIAYKGPGGARFEIHEGAVCAAGCTTADTAIGTAPFGDTTGELCALWSGFLLSVDADRTPSWQAIGRGIDIAAFKSLCAALAVVGKGG